MIISSTNLLQFPRAWKSTHTHQVPDIIGTWSVQQFHSLWWRGLAPERWWVEFNVIYIFYVNTSVFKCFLMFKMYRMFSFHYSLILRLTSNMQCSHWVSRTHLDTNPTLIYFILPIFTSSLGRFHYSPSWNG